jgi:transposase
MRPQRPFTTRQIKAIQAELKKPHTTEEFKRLQALALRAQHGMPAPEIAKVLGLHVASVWKIHARFLKHGKAVFTSRRHGGRHHENLKTEQERALLDPLREAAQKGALVTSRQVKAAYEKEVGKAVPASTVCRMLRRQGWRRLVPRPAHPKASAARRRAFKKTSPVSCGGTWTPFPPGESCG